MFDAVGLDTDYTTRFFDAVADPIFSGIVPTTWPALVDSGFIKRLPMQGFTCQLRAPGWIEGMRLAGVLDSREVHERCQAIAAAIKRRVNRYDPTDELSTFDAIASETGTSVGWCFNAIESGPLSKVFPSKDMRVRVKYPAFFIPPTFGHD
jgi:hypothetical protein